MRAPMLSCGMLGCRAAEVFPTEQFKTMRARCISQELSWKAPAKKWCDHTSPCAFPLVLTTALSLSCYSRVYFLCVLCCDTFLCLLFPARVDVTLDAAAARIGTGVLQGGCFGWTYKSFRGEHAAEGGCDNACPESGQPRPSERGMSPVPECTSHFRGLLCLRISN